MAPELSLPDHATLIGIVLEPRRAATRLPAGAVTTGGVVSPTWVAEKADRITASAGLPIGSNSTSHDGEVVLSGSCHGMICQTAMPANHEPAPAAISSLNTRIAAA